VADAPPACSSRIVHYTNCAPIYRDQFSIVDTMFQVAMLRHGHCYISIIIRPQRPKSHRMSPTLKTTRSQFWEKLQNLGRNALTDVSQILAQSGRDMGLSYLKEIVSRRLSTVH